MSRGVILLFGCGALGLAALWLVGPAALPSYLSAWLVVLAVPIGALPLVMAHDLLANDLLAHDLLVHDRPDKPLVAALRLLLPTVVPAAILAAPVLLNLAVLYPTMATGDAFAAAWMTPKLVIGRGLAFLLIWIVLAFVFGRPRPPGLAAFGLVLHLVMGTLAVDDWLAAADPGLASSSVSLLVMAAQCGVALSVACLLSPASRAPAAPAVVVGLAVWIFLQFTQFLVVWSANLPGEVLWMLRRDRGLGEVAEIAAMLVVLLSLVTMVSPWRERAVGVTAAAVLVLHTAEMFWFIVPASRGSFELRWADLVALVGLAGLLGGSVLMLTERRPARG